MFKLKGSKEERKRVAIEFKQALMELPEKIDVLETIEVGINDNISEEWDLVLTACVNKMEDIAVYANHPAHIAAASIVGPYKDLRACVDYIL